jgi:amino acid transporter
MSKPLEQQAPPAAVPPVQRKGSLLRTIRAVAWSFIGLRKGSEYAQDVEKLNPLHIIVVGLVAVFLLVISLIVLVKVIV